MKFRKDKGTLKRFFDLIQKKYFKKSSLYLVKFLYCFWEGEKYTSDGRRVLGETRSLSPRERDLYSYDFLISIDYDYWKEATSDDKRRLALHELKHCLVITEYVNKEHIPKLDKEGRIKIKLLPHDLNVNLFLDEIEQCGLPLDEETIMFEALKASRKHRKKTKKKGAK
jgi:hypothetical protein